MAADLSFVMTLDPALVSLEDEGCKEVYVRLNDSGHIIDEEDETVITVCVETKMLDEESET